MHIDHLVWYCGDLAAGRDTIAAQAGAVPVYGGEHPGEGTANCLLSLGPSTYLEILGRDAKQSEASLDPLMRALPGKGLYHWAVSGVDLRVLQEQARKAGLAGGDLVSGGRTKPDGTRLNWTCFGLRDHGFGALIPFFIDWHDTPHPAGTAPRGARLARFEVFTPRAAELRSVFTALDLPLTVSQQETAGFTATLESRRGSFQLHSFSPVPAGYVI